MQRGRDCGIAALATYLQLKYEDANDAILLALGRRLGAGVYGSTLIRAAKALGRRLRRSRRQLNLQEHVGILGLDSPSRAHFVVLLGDGQLYDPEDNSLWDVDDYLSAYGFKPDSLLV